MRFSPLACSLIVMSTALSACVTTPEPAPEVVEVTPPPIVETCYPIDSLQKVVVPAVIKTGYSIVSIESPAEYYKDPKTGKLIEISAPPIETKTPYSKVVTPERIYYKTPTGEITDDICEHTVALEPTSPASAATIPAG